MLRLPILIDHFTAHKKLVGDISLWQFLVMHYNTNQSHDSDDERLPFKDPGHSFTASTLAIPINKIVLTETQFIAEVSHVSFYKETFVSSHLNTIFQPPRV